MSLELGPRGLLVFEDYAKGNSSSSNLTQRKGIPGRFDINMFADVSQICRRSVFLCFYVAVMNLVYFLPQCLKGPHFSPRNQAQPPVLMSPFTGKSTQEISLTASRSTAWRIHMEVNTPRMMYKHENGCQSGQNSVHNIFRQIVPEDEKRVTSVLRNDKFIIGLLWFYTSVF